MAVRAEQGPAGLCSNALNNNVIPVLLIILPMNPIINKSGENSIRVQYGMPANIIIITFCMKQLVHDKLVGLNG